MKKEKLRDILLNHITEDEWTKLEHKDKMLLIGEFNREMILKMRNNSEDVSGDVTEELVVELYGALKDYLEKYMAEHPDGHKWIYIASIYLTYIEQIPMHPQERVRWINRANTYFCPCHSGEDSVCRYCVCGKLDY